MFSQTLTMTEAEDQKAEVGFLRHDDTWQPESPPLKPGDLVRNRRIIHSTDGEKPMGTLWRIIKWVPHDNPPDCWSLQLVGREHESGGGPTSYRIPGNDLELVTPLEATEAAIANMAAAAADFMIGTILYEQAKAEREATERALARVEALNEEHLAKIRTERAPGWPTHLARWWAALWTKGA